MLQFRLVWMWNTNLQYFLPSCLSLRLKLTFSSTCQLQLKRNLLLFMNIVFKKLHSRQCIVNHCPISFLFYGSQLIVGRNTNSLFYSKPRISDIIIHITLHIFCFHNKLQKIIYVLMNIFIACYR